MKTICHTILAAGLIAMGALADCCVVDGDWAQRLQDDAQANPVHLTLIGGNVA